MTPIQRWIVIPIVDWVVYNMLFNKMKMRVLLWCLKQNVVFFQTSFTICKLVSLRNCVFQMVVIAVNYCFPVVSEM
jgi:hypothetical protein